MKAKELKKKYLKFFKEKEHAIISSASLIPENDPSVLFTTAGMHPLVPFLMGEKHPQGKRIANVQKCIRTGDIDDVGDASHLTFFEMLGNWSLGDYFKEEAIKWSYEFITDKKWLGLDVENLHVTVFAGDKDAPKDSEAEKVWLELGIPKERIHFLPKEDNWWGPAGDTGPCGPDTEMFIDTGKDPCSKKCGPGCYCGKYFEIWNDVFMQYNKTADGKYEKLKQHNVDTGMGVERTVAMVQGKSTIYEIETFAPIVDKIKKLAKIDEPGDEQTKHLRIISDHLRSAAFILSEGRVVPSNLDQGYILRRLIRRSIRSGRQIGIEENFCKDIAKVVSKIFRGDYPEFDENKDFILNEIEKEEDKFSKALTKGLKQFEKFGKDGKISGKDAFMLFSTHGFPVEMTEELAKEEGFKFDKKEFNKEFEKHQKLSRKGAEKKFKGGLSDASYENSKLHTATHLLHQALRKVLGDHVKQMGSNITPERLRFDFSHDAKLSDEEKQKVEDIVNENIKAGLEVKREEMSVKEARKAGAHGLFADKYGEKVSVYTIKGFSKEICMGPHVKNTSELGHFKIKKEKAVAAGIRRIKAVLEEDKKE
ncbi:MAG: alanine--tRNA ligase [Nanoarchaeota archaeon]|nr:alanine--tRNA ligase [Nanoarchaeota archaeon]